MKLIDKCIVGLLLCSLFSVNEAVAAAKVTITQTSERTYSISVADVVRAAAIDFSILYDKDTLSNPVIENGPFATSASAISVPYDDATRGVFRVVYVTTANFEGSGLLATVSFTKTGKASSRLPDLQTSIFSIDGVQVAAQAVIDTTAAASTTATTGAAGTAATTATTGTTGTTTTTTTTGAAATTGIAGTMRTSATTGTAYSGTTSFPVTPQQEHKDEPKKQEYSDEHQPEARQQDSPPPSVGSSVAASAGLTNDSGKKTALQPSPLRSIQGVLARFRDYKGARTLKGFAAVFDNNEAKAAGIIQSPSIVVSDGKALVTVALDLPNDAAPSFSLKGANMKSIRRVSGKKWELDALPQKGKTDVRLSILLKGESAEVPLVVVPPLDRAAVKLEALSPSALDALLAKPLKNNKPAYDLNSDGKQDYLDDYILVAHWLLKQRRGVRETGIKGGYR